METLYSKLYDKYTKLKTKKDSEMEQLNHDLEEKFINHINAAEDLIEHLRNENERLRAQINDLKNEVASFRSAKEGQCAEYQKLLMEENQKSKELSEEVERLCNLQREGLCCSTKDGNNENERLKSPSEGSQIGSKDLSSGSTIRITRKRARHHETQTEEARDVPNASGQIELAMVREPERDSYKGAPPDDALGNIHQPECCGRNHASAGGAYVESANSLFQALVEYLVGMKLSAVSQTEGSCVEALHQSSGYSFSLTWVSKPAGEDAELLYRVLSLGTFERVAPEWMREVMMFSTSMCPIFFERISQVIKLHR